jgi:HTH-type transcriptional regulator / antitoxin HipB
MIVRNSRELGHLIRDHRTRRGLTQAQLAAQTGASRKWIIDLESGKRAADLSLVFRTLNALGLELDVRDRSTRTVRGGQVDLDAIIDSSRKGRS